MKMIKPIVNLSKIAEDYDTFVFGFNGGLSDGAKLFPEALNCLRNLAAMGKKIVIISNTCLRVAEVVDAFRQVQFPLESFSNIVWLSLWPRCSTYQQLL